MTAGLDLRLYVDTEDASLFRIKYSLSSHSSAGKTFLIMGLTMTAPD